MHSWLSPHIHRAAAALSMLAAWARLQFWGLTWRFRLVWLACLLWFWTGVLSARTSGWVVVSCWVRGLHHPSGEARCWVARPSLHLLGRPPLTLGRRFVWGCVIAICSFPQPVRSPRANKPMWRECSYPIWSRNYAPPHCWSEIHCWTWRFQVVKTLGICDRGFVLSFSSSLLSWRERPIHVVSKRPSIRRVFSTPLFLSARINSLLLVVQRGVVLWWVLVEHWCVPFRSSCSVRNPWWHLIWWHLVWGCKCDLVSSSWWNLYQNALVLCVACPLEPLPPLLSRIQPSFCPLPLRLLAVAIVCPPLSSTVLLCDVLSSCRVCWLTCSGCQRWHLRPVRTVAPFRILPLVSGAPRIRPLPGCCLSIPCVPPSPRLLSIHFRLLPDWVCPPTSCLSRLQLHWFFLVRVVHLWCYSWWYRLATLRV